MRVSSYPCKVYFTQEDFDADTNYLTVGIPSVFSPYGEWESFYNSNYIWLRGDDGSSTIELVCSSSTAEYPNDYGLGPMVSGGGLSAPVATITHSHSGLFNAPADGLSGAGIHVEWGDGASDDYTLMGIGVDVPLQHTYADSSTKTIGITGDVDAINKLWTESMDVLSVQYAPLSGLYDVSFYNNPDLEVSGLAGTSIGILYLGYCTNLSDISPLVGISTLTSLFLINTSVSYPLGGLSWFTAASGTFRFDSCVSTSAEVDQWLIDLNNASWANCTIRIDGTNPAPTAASAAAIAALTARGCVVYTN